MWRYIVLIPISCVYMNQFFYLVAIWKWKCTEIYNGHCVTKISSFKKRKKAKYEEDHYFATTVDAAHSLFIGCSRTKLDIVIQTKDQSPSHLGMDAGKWTLKNKQKKKIYQMMECSFKSFALQFALLLLLYVKYV